MKICFAIDNVFSSKEWTNIIARTEEQDQDTGYHEATIRNMKGHLIATFLMILIV